MSTGGDEPTLGICPSCGSSTYPSDQFCRSCGAGMRPSDAITTPWAAAPGPSGPPPATALAVTLDPTGPATESSSPAAPWWRRPAVIAAAAAGAVAVILLVVLLAVVFGSGSDEHTVAAPALVAGEPVTVPLEGNTAATRMHRVRMSRGDTATVFVTGNRRFQPAVEVVGPDSEPVATETVALGNKGGAATFVVTGNGPQSIRISSFSDEQSDYQVELRNVRFKTPEQLVVGDCVSRYDDEAWAHVSGFTVRPCDRAHEGQVFEQVPGFGNEATAAQDQCDVARNQRVRLPGYVHWRAYWGDDLTCIVVAGNGSGTLNESLVTTD